MSGFGLRHVGNLRFQTKASQRREPMIKAEVSYEVLERRVPATKSLNP